MSPAILIFTLIRLGSPRTLLSMFMLTIAFPFILGIASHNDEMSDMLLPLLTHSLLPMLIGFMIVAEQVANAKNVADGEYMALLFTRPISRASYVFSKWIAGSIGVFICVLTAYMTYLLGETAAFGQFPGIDPQQILSGGLNCLSCVALIVVISCVPMRLGLFLFAVTVYVSMFGPLLTSFGVKSASSATGTTAIATGWLLQLLQTILRPSIDIAEISNAAQVNWMPVISYVSNISIYLLVATWIMSKREFYYASE